MKKNYLAILMALFVFAAITPASANPLGISVDGFQDVSSVATAQENEREIVLNVTNVSSSTISNMQISIITLTEESTVIQGAVTTVDIQPGQQVTTTVARIQTNGSASDYMIQVQYTDINGNPIFEKHPFVM